MGAGRPGGRFPAEEGERDGSTVAVRRVLLGAHGRIVRIESFLDVLGESEDPAEEQMIREVRIRCGKARRRPARRPARQTAQVGCQGRHSRKQCEDSSHDGQAVAELAQRDLPWRSRRTLTGSRRQRRKVNNLVDGMPEFARASAKSGRAASPLAGPLSGPVPVLDAIETS
jgi:hypothetical protein